MLDEAGVVRSGPEWSDREVLGRIGGDFRVGLGLLGGAGRQGLDAQPGPHALADRDARLGIGHVGGDLVHQPLEVVAAGGLQEAAAIAVGVDVDHRLFLEFVAVGLGPFGGAQQHWFLGVPAGVDQRPLGLPALLRQGAYGLGLGHEGDLP